MDYYERMQPINSTRNKLSKFALLVIVPYIANEIFFRACWSILVRQSAEEISQIWIHDMPFSSAVLKWAGRIADGKGLLPYQF